MKEKVGFRNLQVDALVPIQSKLSLSKLGKKNQANLISFKSGKYNCTQTWNEIRSKHPEVNLWKLIWFSIAIPGHAFIGRLAIRNRWATQDRLL